MWQLQQPAPGVFDWLDVPAPSAEDLKEGEVLLRYGAGAICGSDIPKFLGYSDPDLPHTGLPGVPLHELVGRVEASRDPKFSKGDRAVGIIKGSGGLSEYLINPGRYMAAVDASLNDVEATMIQPLATVLSAYSQISKFEGKDVVVLGLGPLGLLFTHIAKTRGAGSVTGIDRVDRSDVAELFGIDHVVTSDVRHWVEHLSSADKPDLIIDAIGHRQELTIDAVEAVKPGGEIFLFGLPEDHYVFPMRAFFRKQLTMRAGSTQDWGRFLAEASEYLVRYPDLPRHYITDTYSIDDAQAAYSSYARPRAGRLKVALTPPHFQGKR